MAPTKKPTVEIVDPDRVTVKFVDWFLGYGNVDGVIHLYFGTTDHTMRKATSDPAGVVVAAKLRMPKDFATRLHKLLSDVLQPADRSMPKTDPNQTLN